MSDDKTKDQNDSGLSFTVDGGIGISVNRFGVRGDAGGAIDLDDGTKSGGASVTTIGTERSIDNDNGKKSTYQGLPRGWDFGAGLMIGVGAEGGIRGTYGEPGVQFYGNLGTGLKVKAGPVDVGMAGTIGLAQDLDVPDEVPPTIGPVTYFTVPGPWNGFVTSQDYPTSFPPSTQPTAQPTVGPGGNPDGWGSPVGDRNSHASDYGGRNENNMSPIGPGGNPDGWGSPVGDRNSHASDYGGRNENNMSPIGPGGNPDGWGSPVGDRNSHASDYSGRDLGSSPSISHPANEFKGLDSSGSSPSISHPANEFAGLNSSGGSSVSRRPGDHHPGTDRDEGTTSGGRSSSSGGNPSSSSSNSSSSSSNSSSSSSRSGGSSSSNKSSSSRGRAGSNNGTSAKENETYGGGGGYGGGYAHAKPVILDLDGDGVELILQDSSQTRIDFDDDGYFEQTAWAAPDDGILVIDLAEDGSAGADGKITDVKELAFTEWDETATTDLDGVRKAFDSNGNDILDSEDERYDEFRIWQDIDSDGIADEGELRTLEEAGIKSINLISDNEKIELEDGSTVFGLTEFQKTDGSIGLAADVAFKYNEFGYRVVETENGFTIETESGESLDFYVHNEETEAHIDLAAEDYISAFGGIKADELDASLLETGVILDGYLGDDTLLGGAGDDLIVGGEGVDVLKGGAGHDILFADGDDLSDLANIDGGEGFDQLLMTDDTVLDLNVDEMGIEAVVSGDGDDVLAGQGAETNYAFVSGAGNDQLSTGDGDDYLAGGEGDDRLDSGAGDDQLYGEAGTDTLDGGEGDDLIVGGEGDDILNGGAGNDVYYFDRGDGKDRIHDYAEGTYQEEYTFEEQVEYQYNVSVQRGSGKNKSWVNETRTGYRMETYQGYREVFGEIDGGIDTLLFGAGIALGDIVLARSDNDMVVSLRDEDNADTLSDDEVTIEDWVDQKNRIENFSFTDGTKLDFSQIMQGAYGFGADDTLTGTEEGDFLSGGNGDDILTGNAGRDIIIGGDGSDTLDGGADKDFLFADAGDDTVRGQDGDDYLIGGEGDDTLDGGNGDDTLAGQAGNDIILGGEGNDLILGGTGDDFLQGGSGDDTYIYFRGDGKDEILDEKQIEETYQEWTGNYTWRSSGKSGSWVKEYRTAKRMKHIDAGNDTLQFGFTIALADIFFETQGEDLLMGLRDLEDTSKQLSELDDQLTIKRWSYEENRIETFELASGITLDMSAITTAKSGYDGDDTLIGTANGDILSGGAGNDTLEAQAGDDYLIGGEGDDTLDAGDGKDDLFGGEGNDTLKGGAGEDYLLGGAGDDILEGGVAKDVLTGGTGDDLLNGGLGDDTYIYNRGDGKDTIDETAYEEVQEAYTYTQRVYKSVKSGKTTKMAWVNETRTGYKSVTRAAEGGDDTLQFGTNIDISDLILSMSGDDLLVQLQPLEAGTEITDQVTIKNWTSPEFRVENFRFINDFAIDLGNIDHAKTGDQNSNIITPNDNQASWLSGGAGDDTLSGSTSNDVLFGGTDDDMTDGGKGDDTYIFNRGDGHDTISDAGSSSVGNDQDNPGGDKLLFGAGLTIEDLTLHRDGDDMVIYLLDADNPDTPLSALDDSIRIENWASTSNRIELLQFFDGTDFDISNVARTHLGALQADDTPSRHDFSAAMLRSDLDQNGVSSNSLASQSASDEMLSGLGDGTLRKVSGGASWNAGAYSSQSFTGAGSVSTTVALDKQYIMLGLSSDKGNSGYDTIDYAIYQHVEGYLHIYENGRNVHSSGRRYGVGDELTVERLDDGTVQYLQNGTIFYTSGTKSSLSTELLVDVSILSGEVGQTTLVVGDQPVEAVHWIGTQNVETSVPDDLEVSYTDIDGDGHVDAALHSSDGRIWTRKGRGDGHFDAAVARRSGLGDGTLRKVSGGASWNAGAYSSQSFTGAGSVSTTVALDKQYIMLGLSSDKGNSGYDTIDYAIYQHVEGYLHIYENGRNVHSSGRRYGVGDELTVERLDDGTVQYLQNGTIFYTSGTKSSLSTELLVDVSILSGEVGQTTLVVGDQPVEAVHWIGTQNVETSVPDDLEVSYTDIDGDGHVDAALHSSDGRIWTRKGRGDGHFDAAVARRSGLGDGTLRKVSGGASWNAGAYSSQSFTGAGSVSTTVALDKQYIMLGLSSDKGNSGYDTIDYAIYQHVEGYLHIYENGRNVHSSGRRYGVGDELTVERLDDGTVQYLQNGTIFYTSGTKSSLSTELLVDVSILSGEVGQTTLVVGDQPVEAVHWIGTQNVETSVPDDLEVSYTDIDGDGHVDAALHSSDGRIWTRKGRGDGHFDAAVARRSGLGDGTLRKVSGGASWNAGAYSSQSFTGAGSVSTTVALDKQYIMLGLSSDKGNSGYDTIDYAIYQHVEGYLHIYENGRNVHSSGRRYGVGDELTVERLDDGTVQYLQNGTIFYTSGTKSSLSTELLVDVSILSGEVGQTTLVVGDQPVEAVHWIGTQNVETSVPDDLEVSYTDIDGDGHVDAALHSSDGRIWTRKGRGDGENSSLLNNNDILAGSSSADWLDGFAGDDMLYGRSGDDYLFGRDGDDQLFGEAGDDILAGNDGNDTIDGGSGDDVLYAMAGDDILRGGDGKDILVGGSGDDTLDGGQGDDVIIGDTGNDTYIASEGYDDYRFGYGDGQDIYQGSSDAKIKNTDVIILEDNVKKEAIWFDRFNADLSMQILGTEDKFIFKNWYASEDMNNNKLGATMFGVVAGEEILRYGDVQSLVNAMASFDPNDGTTAYGVTSSDLPDSVQVAVNAAWKAL